MFGQLALATGERKDATMANECGTMLLGCREAFNDRPKRAIHEEQAVAFFF